MLKSLKLVFSISNNATYATHFNLFYLVCYGRVTILEMFIVFIIIIVCYYRSSYESYGLCMEVIH